MGLPDVTMFPVIAEAMQVPIGVLFGEDIGNANKTEHHFSYYGASDSIQAYLGNICRVEFVEDENVNCSVLAYGDEVFLNYFDVEQDDNTLRVNVKNPSGSEKYWEKYDRRGYKGENYVRICTGRKKDETNIQVINYLDLEALATENEEGNYQVQCNVEDRRKFFESANKCQVNRGLEENIIMHRKRMEEYPGDVYVWHSLCELLYKKI